MMSPRIYGGRILCAAIAIVCGWTAAGADILVQRIDGPPIDASQVTLQEASIKIAPAEDVPKSPVIARELLISLRFDHDPVDTPQGSLLEFANGDRLIATVLEVSESAVRARVGDEEIHVPLGQLRGIVWNASTTDAGWWPMLFRERGADDLVLLTNGDRSAGQFAGAGETDVRLLLEGRTLAIPRRRVAAIAFSPELISVPAAPPERQIVLTTSGWLTVTGLTGSTNGTLEGQTRFGETIQFRAGSIRRIQFLGSHVISLTDIKPAQVEFTPWLSRQWPVRFNRSLTDHPLALEEQVYTRGIGMHSRTRISYALDGKYDRFSVTAGLADSAGSLGNVAIAIEVDGEIVERRERVTRGSGRVEFDGISVTDAETLRLIADFGANGDIRDRVNWCAPILIRDADGKQ